MYITRSLSRTKLSPLFLFINPMIMAEFRRQGLGLYYNRRERGMYTQLRRNIHRIEKGLVHENRRKVFALDFIGATCDSLVFLNNALTRVDREYFISVLKQYFTVVDEKVVKKYCTHAVSEVLNSELTAYSGKSYRFSSRDSVSEFLNNRYSVRSFMDEVIDSATVNSILNSAKNVPSSCNRMPYRVICLRGAESREALDITLGARGWLSNIHNAFLIIGDYSAFEFLRDRNVLYLEGGLIVSSLGLSIHNHGLDSVIVNWSTEYFVDKAISRKLNLSSTEVILSSIVFGKAKIEAKSPISIKKHL